MQIPENQYAEFVDAQLKILETARIQVEKNMAEFHDMYCDSPLAVRDECRAEFSAICAMEMVARKALHRNVNRNPN